MWGGGYQALGVLRCLGVGEQAGQLDAAVGGDVAEASSSRSWGQWKPAGNPASKPWPGSSTGRARCPRNASSRTTGVQLNEVAPAPGTSTNVGELEVLMGFLHVRRRARPGSRGRTRAQLPSVGAPAQARTGPAQATVISGEVSRWLRGVSFVLLALFLHRLDPLPGVVALRPALMARSWVGAAVAPGARLVKINRVVCR